MIRVSYYEHDVPEKFRKTEFSIVVQDMDEFYEALPPASRPTTVTRTVVVEWDEVEMEWVEVG